MAEITPGSNIDLAPLTAQESSLAAAAGSGGFSVDPDAASQAARICQNYAEDVSGLLGQHDLSGPPFLGSFWMANDLAQHFRNKAAGSTMTTDNTGPYVTSVTEPNSLAGQVAGIVQLLNNLGKIFGTAAGNYTQKEQDIQGSFQKFGGHSS